MGSGAPVVLTRRTASSDGHPMDPREKLKGPRDLRFLRVDGGKDGGSELARAHGDGAVAKAHVERHHSASGAWRDEPSRRWRGGQRSGSCMGAAAGGRGSRESARYKQPLGQWSVEGSALTAMARRPPLGQLHGSSSGRARLQGERSWNATTRLVERGGTSLHSDGAAANARAAAWESSGRARLE